MYLCCYRYYAFKIKVSIILQTIQQNNLFYYQLGKKNRVVCVLGTVLLTDPLLRSCDAKIESLMPCVSAKFDNYFYC